MLHFFDRGLEITAQPWILAAEQSGLSMHIATTGERLVVHADELLTAFLELKSVISCGGTPEDRGGRKIKLDKLSRIE